MVPEVIIRIALHGVARDFRYVALLVPHVIAHHVLDYHVVVPCADHDPSLPRVVNNMAYGIIYHKSEREGFILQRIDHSALFIGAYVTHEHHITVVDDTISILIVPDGVAAHFLPSFGLHIFFRV